MNNKQKILLLSITLILTIAIGAVTFTVTTPKPENKISIVATFYPLAYLTEQIGGDHVAVTQLVPNNTEIHTWQPSASHIVATEDADIIVYNGAGADHWMEDDILPALSTNENRIVVETTNGLQLIANQEHEHDEETGEEEHDHGTYDPHTWISPYMAKLQAEKIYTAIVQADPENKEYYTQRWQTLESQLTELDTEYSQGLSEKSYTSIFVSHEAFGYLSTRYGFEQHGVIGLSADEQPSTTTIANLVQEMLEHETYTVYVDPVYSTEYAQTIKTEVEAKTGHTVTVLNLYLMLGPNNGMDYLAQMQANLASLEAGLTAP
jgi:zinc transport system substrate-binding protein